MTATTSAASAKRRGIQMGLLAAVLAFAIDQVTKQVALAALSRGEVQPVMPFLDLRVSFNEGVSFGMFAQVFAGRPVALAAITLAVVVLLALLLVRTSTRPEAVALGAAIGGALGNIVDRLRLGAVVDFLDFHVLGYHWPAFNLADAAIVGGLAVLVLRGLVRP